MSQNDSALGVPNPLPLVQSQLDTGLDRLDAASTALARQRSALVLQGVALRIAQASPDAVDFTIGKVDGTRWEILRLADANGQNLPVDQDLTRDLNTLLTSGPVTPEPSILPEAATERHDAMDVWEIPVQQMWHRITTEKPTVIDIDQLTDAEFTDVIQAAQDSLGMLGVVRTKDDIIQEIVESPTIRDDISEEDLAVATTLVHRKYRETQEQSGGAFDEDYATFCDTVEEVAEYLGLSTDTDPASDITRTPPTFGPGRTPLA